MFGLLTKFLFFSAYLIKSIWFQSEPNSCIKTATQPPPSQQVLLLSLGFQVFLPLRFNTTCQQPLTCCATACSILSTGLWQNNVGFKPVCYGWVRSLPTVTERKLWRKSYHFQLSDCPGGQEEAPAPSCTQASPRPPQIRNHVYDTTHPRALWLEGCSLLYSWAVFPQ